MRVSDPLLSSQRRRPRAEAIRLKPDYVLAFNNRGIARRAKGDLEGALQDSNEAIRLGYKPFQKG